MKTINIKRPTVLSLTITLLLTMGIVGYVDVGYADSNDERESENESSPYSNSNVCGTSIFSNNHSSDSECRGTTRVADRNITICHVPKGNPSNKHTIHIGYSAWPAHRDNHGGDYLGSCTKAAPSDPSGDPQDNTDPSLCEELIVSGCEGNDREDLIDKVQSYFEPIVVRDDQLDDKVTPALSQCIDNGDSDDSTFTPRKDDRGNGKGGGHATHSDSGHYSVSACKHRGIDDSDSNDFRGNLISEHNKKNNGAHGDSNVILTDSSLDDPDVRKEYDDCLAKQSTVKTGLGDSGHKYNVVKNCNNPALKKKIEAHKARAKSSNDDKYKNRSIILTKKSLEDKDIKKGYDKCLAQRKVSVAKSLSITCRSPYDPGDPRRGDINPLPIINERGRLNWRETTK